MTSSSEKKPNFTALSREARLPRSVRGPVENLVLTRFAAAFFVVTVFLLNIVRAWTFLGYGRGALTFEKCLTVDHASISQPFRRSAEGQTRDELAQTLTAVILH